MLALVVHQLLSGVARNVCQCMGACSLYRDFAGPSSTPQNTTIPSRPHPLVREQGSEIIRLYHTLLGPQGFRKGMDLYFKRHDGQVGGCLTSFFADIFF